MVGALTVRVRRLCRMTGWAFHDGKAQIGPLDEKGAPPTIPAARAHGGFRTPFVDGLR